MKPNPFLKKGQGASYTPADHEAVEKIKKWLIDHEMTRAWLARKTRIPSGTVSQILSCKYVSSPTRQLEDMAAALKVETDRGNSETSSGYHKGSVHKLMSVVCERTRLHQSFGVVTGFVGVGKTRFCREYRSSTPQTILIEASPNMTPGVLLAQLLRALNTPAPPGLDAKFQECVRVLKGTNFLLMIDEAENCSSAALEYIRRIRDMATIGILLTGTEKLRELIQPHHGQFDQIRSRVSMWPKTIEQINRDDADEIAREALSDMGEVNDDLLDALWAYCAGSARVLTESLIPALRDFAGGRKLSPDLVDAIAANVLFMAHRKGGKA